MVVLAAGQSKRLGQPKALAKIQGLSLLSRTLRVLAPLATGRIIVVVPPGAGRYRIGPYRDVADFTVNPYRATGLSSSVRIGVARSRRRAAVLLLPVDLADLQRRDIERLIARWRGSRRRVAARRIDSPAPLAADSYGRPTIGAGTPLILPRWLYSRALALTGDQGLRDVVRSLPKDLMSLLHLPSAQHDIDTPADLQRARRRPPSRR
jgi:molybdenum cofactor cytidylyltransferase